ncbi:ester cyclase [Streptomyces kunmingensis]|uniref:Ester cyclase n=1 Tax=Streptomyces kunmingensis TaxID=68225 RepID=A0ABU6CLA9_9ACTN|nr:ester cyclase [Streptomyces kunmingensis]MEB3964685.1 ester cyclase [Streptomyces kunmingensis]
MPNAEPTELYRRFLDAFNAADHATVAGIIGQDFVDHHPGFDIKGLDDYLAALRDAHATWNLKGELEEALAVGDDKVVTRVKLTGTHGGAAFGYPATGRAVEWSTTEIWRAEDGRLVERWAQDDLLGLREQVSTDAANLATVQAVSDAVNERRYDDLDELFGPTFRDNNPAWDVASLDELKVIIKAAHDALDFTVGLDALYPAAPDKVIMHITFRGKHIAPFFGQEPDGREVSWTSLEVYRLEDAKVVERWVQADTAGLMRQLDVPLP